ncbi:MAG TPA: citrate lyase acyl carrier protein, partial [Candidatus Krumholzibacteria bacterium]|nr:citrate lyase acyl carrier protein [Candidatus Krumholzibacteria bacterium]
MATKAEAGKRGAQVRSDCWIGVEPAAAGGLQVALTSKVAGMYGDRIVAQIEEGCRVLGLVHGTVTVEDQGALPYVIAARLETAVRRAGLAPAAPLLPVRRDLAVAPTSRDRLRRSRLYLPGNEPKFHVNAALHEPDGVILDLE